MDLTRATPVEVDTRLADIHQEIFMIGERLERAENTVFGWAGRREYVPATWQNRRSRYVNHGTYEEAREETERRWAEEQAWRAADYPQDARPAHKNSRDGYDIPFEGPQKTLDEVERLRAERYRKMTQANEMDAEWIRRGRWSRFWLVVSSAGHIHKTTGCQTCRRTTRFGWMPEYSGMTEEEAIAKLGRWAESLCSVCFPAAPVAKRNITTAQAAKLSAATYVSE